MLRVGLEEGPEDGRARVQLERRFGEGFLEEASVKLGFEGCIGVCLMRGPR